MTLPTDNGTKTWTYTYDANGMRTKRTDETTTYEYVYNGSQLTHVMIGFIKVYITYDASGKPLTLNVLGSDYYYETNLQGDVIGIYNSNGNKLVEYTYDAWGKILSITDNSTYRIGILNPLRYRGYVYDDETELYYLQSRYYDPELGRFINTDTTNILTATPMGLTDKNLFAYCDNNPVIRADYGGDFWHIVVGGVIGGVASFAATLLTGGSIAEAGVSALFGAASGALTAALPGAGLLIDVGFGVAEEVTMNLIKKASLSEATVDMAISAGVDSLSNITNEGSCLTKETMQDLADAVPRTFKGNHPRVKRTAQRIVRSSSRTVAREGGETIVEKSIGNFFKNILKAIF